MRRGGGRSGRRSGRVCGGGWGAGGGARQSAGARPRRPPRQDSRRYAAHGGAARRRNDVRSGVRRALLLHSAPLPLCPPPSHASPAGSRGVERVDAVVRRSLVCAPIGSRAARCVHRLRLARSAQAEPCLQAGSGVAGRTRPLSTWPAGKRQGACHETRGLRPGGGVGRGEGADARTGSCGMRSARLLVPRLPPCTHSRWRASWRRTTRACLPASGAGGTARPSGTVPCRASRAASRVCGFHARCCAALARRPRGPSARARLLVFAALPRARARLPGKPRHVEAARVASSCC